MPALPTRHAPSHSHTSLPALAAAVLWGVIELTALLRARWAAALRRRG